MSPSAARPPLLDAPSPLLLGLFMPALDGGHSVSSAPRETNFSFDYNRRCVLKAEDMGFDFCFQVGQWSPGYGGRIQYREKVLEAVTTSAALAAVTESITVISTVHVLFGVHPMVVAKQGANIDHISNGRWGINVVAGWAPDDIKIFGLDVQDGADRYKKTTEFVSFLEKAWAEEKPFSFEGNYYRSERAVICPLPRSPLVVSAAMSPAGREFAVNHAHAMFITNPVDGGANPENYDEMAVLIKEIRGEAAAAGRELKLIVNVHAIQRETREEAWEQYRNIVAHADDEALENLSGHVLKNKSIPRWSYEHMVVGGNLLLVGDADDIVQGFSDLHEIGCDGIQLTFFDFLPDMDRFGEQVLPRLVNAGLRAQ